MARILLVQPPHRDTFGYSMPPLGLLHVGAGAREAGHEVELIDLALWARRGWRLGDHEATAPTDEPAEAPSREPFPVDDELIARSADAILARRPDAVGLGAMISSMPAALHLAEALKARRPDLPIILGGQGAETIEEALIGRYACLDAVAVGEADRTLTAWLDRLGEPARWAGVPGLVIRSGGLPQRTEAREVLADLDSVPPVDWTLCESPAAYAAAGDTDGALFPIDLGRGCSFRCTFCTTPVFWGRKARQLSAGRAVSEFERLEALGGVECAYVTHDLFTFDRERVLDICREKIARAVELPWECRTRIDLVDDELLAALSAAGCRRILFGVESDSPAVLERIEKGGRAVDVRDVVRRVSEAGIGAIVGVMAGIPGERPQDVEANLALLADLAVIDGVSLSFHWMNVTPGNDRAAEVAADAASTGADPLALRPPFTADLVRGFDLPLGDLPARQRQLIEEDGEVFAAFRVHGTADLDCRDLYLLSRNAAHLLEALPRTAQALALARRGPAPLLAELLAFLREAADATNGEDSHVAGETSSDVGVWDAALWNEPFVLRRDVAIARFAERARGLGRPELAALATYEEALATVDAPRLVRFDDDPVRLLEQIDAGRRLTRSRRRPSQPQAVLFTRRGERARAHALSPLLADLAEGLDEAQLRGRWPDCDQATLARARQLLASLDA